MTVNVPAKATVKTVESGLRYRTVKEFTKRGDLSPITGTFFEWKNSNATYTEQQFIDDGDPA